MKIVLNFIAFNKNKLTKKLNLKIYIFVATK